MEKYLGSGLIKGVGPKFAKTIVDTFGTETFEIIENHPQRLMEVPKLGRKKADAIVKSWNERYNFKFSQDKQGRNAGFIHKSKF